MQTFVPRSKLKPFGSLGTKQGINALVWFVNAGFEVLPSYLVCHRNPVGELG